MKKYSTDLTNVVEGDLIAISRIHFEVWELVEVERTTNKQIIINCLGDEQKFNRKTGFEVGSTDFFKYKIVAPYQQLLDEIRLRETRNLVYEKVANKFWVEKLNVNQLEQILNILKE